MRGIDEERCWIERDEGVKLKTFYTGVRPYNYCACAFACVLASKLDKKYR